MAFREFVRDYCYALKHAQTLLRRNHTSPLLWSAVSKHGSHLEDSFLMPKHSCKICHTRSIEMFTVSLISRTFNRRSFKTMWILSIFYWEVIFLERPFLVTGIDYCGPFFIKEKRHRNRMKIKIFICFATKAVYIKTISDLTTDAFLS